VQGTEFDEEELFAAIARSGVRVLLIGRRALVALGIPVLTADYDLWIDIDDIGALNAALAWARRRELAYAPNVPLVVPCLDDMILTKRWSLRPKDVDDIAMLEKLKRDGGDP